MFEEISSPNFADSVRAQSIDGGPLVQRFNLPTSEDNVKLSENSIKTKNDQTSQVGAFRDSVLATSVRESVYSFNTEGKENDAVSMSTVSNITPQNPISGSVVLL